VEGNGQNPQNKRKKCLVLLDFELTGMQKKNKNHCQKMLIVAKQGHLWLQATN